MTRDVAYCVVLPLAPLQVGEWIDRRAWPLHLTLVPNVASTADRAMLVDVVCEVAHRLPPLSTTIGEEAWFDPDGSTLVDLAEPADLRPAHELVLDALERRAQAVPADPAYHRDGYRPHVTVTPAARAARGSRVAFRTMALVELGSGDRAHLATPLAVVALTTPEHVPAP